jgi:hypothetical protein
MQTLVGVCLEYDDVYPQLPAKASRPLPPFSLNLKVPGVTAATDLNLLSVKVTGSGGNTTPATLIMLNPSSYTSVAWWDSGWTPRSESAYMGLLASRPDAALVSPGLAASGSQISLQAGTGSGAFTSVGTIPGLPGADMTGPFIITTQATGARILGLQCGTGPCVGLRDVLFRLRPGTSVTAVEQALGGYGLFSNTAQVASVESAQALATPEWAGQSGVLTIGFLVALAVTAAGYLLYAGLLLRGQMNQLGLLRALGLDWSGVVGAVALEQGVLVATGALAGVLTGVIAAGLFLPLFQPAFTGADAPPFLTAGPGAALWEVSVVLVLLFGLVILSLLALLRRMHVGETVRLEEA